MVECIMEVVFSFSVQFLWNKIGFVRQALHHPFTAPHPDDMGDLRSARALAYDLVYNGVEVKFISMCWKWSTILHLLICCMGFKTSLILLYICRYQIGGGSLRIYRRAVQEKVLSAIGLTPEEVCISTWCFEPHCFIWHWRTLIREDASVLIKSFFQIKLKLSTFTYNPQLQQSNRGYLSL